MSGSNVTWPSNASLTRKLRAEAMQQAVEVVEGKAGELVPKRTGKLAGSLYGKVERGGEQGVVGAKAPHGHLVHEGTKAHSLHPRRREVMRIPSGGQALFRKSAQHPGAKGQPFLTDALEQSRGEIERILANRDDLLKEAIG